MREGEEGRTTRGGRTTGGDPGDHQKEGVTGEPHVMGNSILEDELEKGCSSTRKRTHLDVGPCLGLAFVDGLGDGPRLLLLLHLVCAVS